MKNPCFSIAILVAALQAGTSHACYMHINFSSGSFLGSYPGSLAVTLTVRDAVESDLLPALPIDPEKRLEELRKLQSQVASDIKTLTADEDALPISVMLTQSGVWLRLNGPQRGAVYHSSSPASDDPAVLLPDVAYPALIKGSLSSADLESKGVLRVQGKDKPATLAAFEKAIKAMAEANAERRLADLN